MDIAADAAGAGAAAVAAGAADCAAGAAAAEAAAATAAAGAAGVLIPTRLSLVLLGLAVRCLRSPLSMVVLSAPLIFANPSSVAAVCAASSNPD